MIDSVGWKVAETWPVLLSDTNNLMALDFSGSLHLRFNLPKAVVGVRLHKQYVDAFVITVCGWAVDLLVGLPLRDEAMLPDLHLAALPILRMLLALKREKRREQGALGNPIKT